MPRKGIKTLMNSVLKSSISKTIEKTSRGVEGDGYVRISYVKLCFSEKGWGRVLQEYMESFILKGNH